MAKDKRPYFIPEPYGIPFELTEAGEFRQSKAEEIRLPLTRGEAIDTYFALQEASKQNIGTERSNRATNKLKIELNRIGLKLSEVI